MKRSVMQGDWLKALHYATLHAGLICVKCFIALPTPSPYTTPADYILIIYWRMLYYLTSNGRIMNMRILIIEDNPTTADYLCQGLKENYFSPEVASDGKEGLFLATNHPYDLMILDVMLPHIDGWSLITKIRALNIHTPILFLTAKDTVDDRVRGLELGADDYLVKPFAFSELLARIRSLLRRNQPPAPEILQIADLIIDKQKHKAMRNNQLLKLTAKEFMLLLLFANRKSEVLSRTFIAEQVWDINFDSDTNAIDVAIKRLRDKVDKDFDKKLIHSVHGVGYVFEER